MKHVLSPILHFYIQSVVGCIEPLLINLADVANSHAQVDEIFVFEGLYAHMIVSLGLMLGSEN